eukprot:m.73648 g.73648  ORF g.73648 m.73648 type:complete len:87 (+) comp14472_c0_seq1:1265-1525(+)
MLLCCVFGVAAASTTIATAAARETLFLQTTVTAMTTTTTAAVVFRTEGCQVAVFTSVCAALSNSRLSIQSVPQAPPQLLLLCCTVI